MDLADRSIWWSDELYRIVGLEPRSQPIDFELALGCVADDEREAVRERVESAIAGGQPMTLTCRVIRGEGETRVVRTHACVVPDPPRFVGTVLDVTDDAQDEEARRLSSLGGLAATMAHEFNNVLMGIESFASFLLRRKTDPETQNAATHIQQSLRRGRAITDEILRFTRAVPPVLTEIDVRRWLTDFAAAEGRVRLEVGETPLLIRGDPSQLQQVLSNLVSNARDASPPDQPIVLRAAADDGMLDLAVIDRGSGIAPEIRDRIFEPLFTTKRRGKGLGLAVVHQIVRAHGGSIRVRSEVGEGSAFHLRLPLVEGAD